jgi:hypothetical protein
MISRRATKNAASAAKRRNVERGPQSINQIGVVGKKAEGVAGKSGANQAPAKVEEKVAGSKAGRIAISICG